ncbi:MAG: metal ABC transporter permease [Fibrobacterota bacterium]
MTGWHGLLARLPFEWAQYGFMHNALLAVLFVTPLFAALGMLLLSNRMAFFPDTIGHSALTGIAIGALAGLADPTGSMLGFSALLALLVTFLRRYSAASMDTLLSIVMASTLALGLVLLSRGGGFARYSRYLIGDLLAVSPGDLTRLLGALVFTLLVYLLFFNRLFLVSLNRPLARSRSLPVFRTEALFAMLTALVVTLSIPWVGLLVVNALLILPVAAARNLARTAFQYFWLSAGLSVGSGIAGLVASFYLSTAAGATIALTASGLFALSVLARRLRA